MQTDSGQRKITEQVQYFTCNVDKGSYPEGTEQDLDGI